MSQDVAEIRSRGRLVIAGSLKGGVPTVCDVVQSRLGEPSRRAWRIASPRPSCSSGDVADGGVQPDRVVLGMDPLELEGGLAGWRIFSRYGHPPRPAGCEDGQAGVAAQVAGCVDDGLDPHRPADRADREIRIDRGSRLVIMCM
jgi:hypothetical protein